MVITSIVSSVIITFIIFVDWKTGPKLWQTIAPILFLCFYVVDYVIIPLLNLGVIIELFIDYGLGDEKYMNSFLIYFGSLYFLRFTEFFTKILPIVKEARDYLLIKTPYLKMDVE